MSSLKILDRTGHSTVEWTPEIEESVAAARSRFDSQREAGYVAYRVRGGQSEAIKDFDEAAEEIIMSPVLAGG